MRQGLSYKNIIGYSYIHKFQRHFMAESNALTNFSGLFCRPLRPDNGHKWNSYGTNYRGFYGVRCVYCNSTLTKKNGFRVNTFQRCYACNNIFNIPAVSFKISDLPRVYCPQCNTSNEIKIARRLELLSAVKHALTYFMYP